MVQNSIKTSLAQDKSHQQQNDNAATAKQQFWNPNQWCLTKAVHRDKDIHKISNSLQLTVRLPNTPTVPAQKDNEEENNNNNKNRIQKRYSRFFTISSQRCELSPSRTLKWPGRNRVQITCGTSNAYKVQVSCYVPLGTKGQLSY